METSSTDMQDHSANKNAIFDDVFRAIAEKMPFLLIPLINEAFHTNYNESEKVIQLRNEHHEAFGNITTDALVQIRKSLYHIECQSKLDGKMVIRMFEYDVAIAIEYAEKQPDGTYYIHFPDSCVLYIRNHDKLPEHHKAVIIFSNGRTVDYLIPVVQAKSYTVDQIFERNLLMLLPYHILRYENFLKSNGIDEKKVDSLIHDYNMINQKLLDYCEEPEKSRLYIDIIDLIIQIAEYIIPNNNPLKEEVSNILCGQEYLLRSEALSKESYQRGMLEHAKNTVINLYKQMMPVEAIASATEITEDQARIWLKEANLL